MSSTRHSPLARLSAHGRRSRRQPSRLSPAAVRSDGSAAPGGTLLSLRGITKRFGPVQALTAVDLDIPAGQVTALAGDNGAGKSVLIKTIAGLWEPEEGQILWDGQEVHLHGPRDAESLGITTIYQDLALCDNLDVVQNMFLGHEPRRRVLLDESTMELAARRTLKDLSVTTISSVRQRVASLSGGQRQSVAVAKAMMFKSKLVIMDEPTAALGVAQTRMVLNLIKTLCAQGIAVIVISHNLNDVFSVADRIAVLHLGRLVAVGPTSKFDPATVVDYMTTGRSARDALTGDSEPSVSEPSRATSTLATLPTAEVAELAHEPAGIDSHDGRALGVAGTEVETPAVLAASLSEYLGAWVKRFRSGESGALPIVIGLALIVVFFQFESSQFLSAINLVNLLVQAAVFVLFAAAEIFALVLSEVDLSAGYVAGVGGFVIAELIADPVNLPWWLAIVAALLVAAAIGAFQGTVIARLRLPSFVVTLAGLLGLQGVMLVLAQVDKAAVGGVISISSTSPVYKLANGNMSPLLGWATLAVTIGVYGAVTLTRAARRRARGLTAPPVSVSVLRIAVAAAGGFALVLVCSLDRGSLLPLSGVPWVVPFVGIILLACTMFMARTGTGRYLYAIGANPEAARRAGINVAAVRTLGFMLSSLTACLAGLVYESRLGSMATNIDGGTLVLFGVAAAVIGGTSLFGGRGKPLHALLGGLVVATVYNGLALMGISAAGQYISTAIVLLAAVIVDALARRRASSTAA